MTETVPANILLVDDDKFLLNMYTMKFVQQGYMVHSCLSADDALKVLRDGFSPDVVLFDITMPGQDGFAFLQSLQGEHLAEHAIKIALTNQNTDAEKAKAKEFGATDYLVKATLIPSEVVNTIKEALAKKASA